MEINENSLHKLRRTARSYLLCIYYTQCVCVYVCVFWGDMRVSVRTRYYVSMNDMQLVPHGTYVPGNRCTNNLF